MGIWASHSHGTAEQSVPDVQMPDIGSWYLRNEGPTLRHNWPDSTVSKAAW